MGAFVSAGFAPALTSPCTVGACRRFAVNPATDGHYGCPCRMPQLPTRPPSLTHHTQRHLTATLLTNLQRALAHQFEHCPSSLLPECLFRLRFTLTISMSNDFMPEV